ncbi:uncharacterized protein LOC107422795 isoform X2 [Ziziphus jujuba]|uniref:Uncharacterized protein LOC107422795 isoform X2 n=1 Tax=Ziziphus jujuba TaxID=326968 RepID=A0A6P4A2P0_ZIZJJ|nr:uncharacterized protein LOC107422795 isoform X2 [Ziziphus jujuba]
MWSRTVSSLVQNIRRRLSTAVRRRIEDEGDWFYSSEWWGSESASNTILRSISDKGNGVVSVVAYPSSRPSEVYWPATERWLQKRFEETHPGQQQKDRFMILGYQWRVLRFNDNTRQSTAKILAAYQESEPGSVCIMQQPHCLAVPYLKSMVSVGLATIASCNFDLTNAVNGKKNMRILCIGHGGGSLPLFLASKIQASIHAMGFPAFSVMTQSGERAFSKPDTTDEVLWKGIHERLLLYESDAEKFILNSNSVYDMIFIDAYDGDDIFPRTLWDPNSPFLKALGNQLHPEHGTVVVNLHSDSELLNPDGSIPSVLDHILPMGKYVSQVGRAYKDVIVGSAISCGGKDSGLGFTVSVPWVCNTSLVVCRGFGTKSWNYSKDMILNTLISKSLEVERVLNLPFSCLQYIKRGFILVD